MIQYKNSNYKNLGLLNYPVLQASDILLYDSDFVAIGHDQRQHLELSRKIAKNINRRVGKNIFKIPVPLINKNVNLVRGLQSNSKMSKSSPNLNDTIFLLDTFEEIEYKINKAKTDCTDIIEYDEIKKPELSNMLKIYSTLANKTINEITLLFQNKNYKFFKEKLTDMLIFRLKFFRKNVCLIKNESYKLKNFMHANNIIAKKIAKKNLLKIYKYTNLI
ncbi:hypothetical protein E5P55_00175 [Candidatus Pinguicoccus supinus]|uniref:tryptophan--tRNA ligase n=1 Tax=Candidatus Pinguicoccus supinus TaxID=2529394 RepID=A0A7T0BRG8_9BACT|nr:hypothetical protein E5P55_00175 [Candidatus Pinguicoccus supinus]